MVELTFAEEPVIAGKPVRAAAAFLSPQDHEGQLTAGMAFQIRDGQKVVGSGHVTAIVDLAASAARARAAGL